MRGEQLQEIELRKEKAKKGGRGSKKAIMVCIEEKVKG